MSRWVFWGTPEHDGCSDKAKHNRQYRAFDAEAAARQDFRTGHLGIDETSGLDARSGQPIKAALAEIPGEVDTDGQPECACEHVGSAKEHAGFQPNGQTGPERSARIGDVRQAKQDAGYQQRDPAAQPFLEQSEDDCAEHDFFQEGRHEADHQ